jgi:rRNA maturation endonuclease Nob1
MSNSTITVRCVGCKSYRSITANRFAKGQPFCPKCGNMEVVVKAKAAAEASDEKKV